MEKLQYIIYINPVFVSQPSKINTWICRLTKTEQTYYTDSLPTANLPLYFFITSTTYTSTMLRPVQQLLAWSSEDKILNAVWVGLLSIEAIMVLAVAAQRMSKRLAAKPQFTSS